MPEAPIPSDALLRRALEGLLFITDRPLSASELLFGGKYKAERGARGVRSKTISGQFQARTDGCGQPWRYA